MKYEFERFLYLLVRVWCTLNKWENSAGRHKYDCENPLSVYIKFKIFRILEVKTG